MQGLLRMMQAFSLNGGRMCALPSMARHYRLGFAERGSALPFGAGVRLIAGKKKAAWRTRRLLSWWAVKDSNLGPID